MKILSKILSLLVLSSALTAVWNPPVNVSAVGDSFQLGGPVLGVNSSNNGIAVWATPGFTDNVIQASFYTFGAGWETPVIISDTSLNPFGGPKYIAQADPTVAINESNYVVAAWEGSEFIDEIEENIEGIFSSFRLPNGTWSPVQRVSALNTVDSDFNPENPFLDVSNSGLTVAVWTELRDDERYIMANFLPFAGVWGTPIELANPVGGNREDTPRVAINSKNDAAAVWAVRSSIGPGNEIGASTYNPGTGLWTTVILDPQSNDTSLPRVSIDEFGNAVAIWTRINGAIREVVSSYFTFATQSWSPYTVLATSDINVEGRLEMSDVVLDQFGNATAVWTLTPASTGISQLFSSRLPLGGTWSFPELITPDGFLDEGLAQIEISADLQGNVIVIFETDDGFLGSISFFPGFGWQFPELITLVTDNIWLNIGYGSCGFALALWWAEGDTTVGAEHLGPSSPVTDFTGSRCCQKFASQKRCICTLNWSPNPCALFYNIYQDGVLIATIPGTLTSFIEPCRHGHTFSITAVNSLGIESIPSTFVLR